MPTFDLGQVVGPQGPQGETGPQGPQGIQGPQGPAGETDTFTVSNGSDELCFVMQGAFVYLTYKLIYSGGTYSLSLSDALRAAFLNAIKTYLPEKTSIEQTVYGVSRRGTGGDFLFAEFTLNVYAATGYLNFKPSSTMIDEYTGNFCFCLTD